MLFIFFSEENKLYSAKEHTSVPFFTGMKEDYDALLDWPSKGEASELTVISKTKHPENLDNTIYGRNSGVFSILVLELAKLDELD